MVEYQEDRRFFSDDKEARDVDGVDFERNPNLDFPTSEKARLEENRKVALSLRAEFLGLRSDFEGDEVLGAEGEMSNAGVGEAQRISEGGWQMLHTLEQNTELTNRIGELRKFTELLRRG